MTKRLLAAICILDAVVGDPRSLPHPVRLIGNAIVRGEDMVRRHIGDRSAKTEFAAGALLSLAVVAASALGGALSARVGGSLAVIVSGAAALAARSLDRALAAVETPLACGDTQSARTHLAAIVGRDTAALDDPEIARAAIETAAESLCDGVIAPLLALRAGGVAAAWAYKAANTLDSMIGHVEPPYKDFGRFAARLDDVANFIPARLTVLLLAVAAPLVDGDSVAALSVARRDGRLHQSPNAGWCEAAMAGALHRRLGGSNAYNGQLVRQPYFGAEYDRPSYADVVRARKLVRAAGWVAMAVAVLSART